MREEGHRYEAPEPPKNRHDREIMILLLGAAVVVVLLLVATGVVPIFS